MIDSMLTGVFWWAWAAIWVFAGYWIRVAHEQARARRRSVRSQAARLGLEQRDTLQ